MEGAGINYDLCGLFIGFNMTVGVDLRWKELNLFTPDSVKSKFIN